MEYIVLASGSKGNSTIISNGEKFIIIDVGLGIIELQNKMNNLGYYKQNVLAVFITHEHSDHTKSLDYFDQSIVYSGEGTCRLKKTNILKPFETFIIDDFRITPLPLSHDAANCFGYVVESGEEKLVLITDTGYVNDKLKPYIKNADYYLFESNHDVQMLMKSARPSFLKSRILSDSGHLSNEMASEELCELIGNKTKEIVFVHMSQEVNTKEKVLMTFSNIAKENKVDISKIKLKVADQKEIMFGGKSYEKVTSNN